MTQPFIYIAFHKPYGIISQFSGDDPKETLASFQFPKNVYPVGRLDKDSEGLLILSNDKKLVDQMLNPKNEKEKTYWVQVENIPDNESLEILRLGNIKIEDYFTKPAKVKMIDPQILERNPPIRTRKTVPTCWLEMTITEGKNRQVRKMTASINHPTLRLIRVAVGKLKLDELPLGKWKEVKKQDLL